MMQSLIFLTGVSLSPALDTKVWEIISTADFSARGSHAVACH